MKKITSLFLLIALVTTSLENAHADIYYTGDGPLFCEPTGGCGYEECRQATCLAPAVALSTVALIAIIAIIAQNRSGHGHGHSHE